MKRKFAWLMLPFLLGVLVWGAKWRAEHPPATQWDLHVRALIAQTSMRVIYTPNTKQRMTLALSDEDEKALIDGLHLSPQVSNRSIVSVGRNGVLDILCHSEKPLKHGALAISILIGLDQRIGKVSVSEPGGSKVYDLHPATTKLWLDRLLDRSRITSRLRQSTRS